MKIKLIVLTSLFALSFSAQASEICQELVANAEEECAKALCEDQDSEEECMKDGDFRVGMQECMYESALPALVKHYNKNNPKNRIGCDIDGTQTEKPAPYAQFLCSSKERQVQVNGNVLENSLSVSVHDRSGALELRDFTSPQYDIEFVRTDRKKEGDYKFAKYFVDFNAWQDMELALPKDIVAGDRVGSFPAFLTVLHDNGDTMVAGDALELKCRAY